MCSLGLSSFQEQLSLITENLSAKGVKGFDS